MTGEPRKGTVVGWGWAAQGVPDVRALGSAPKPLSLRGFLAPAPGSRTGTSAFGPGSQAHPGPGPAPVPPPPPAAWAGAGAALVEWGAWCLVHAAAPLAQLTHRPSLPCLERSHRPHPSPLLCQAPGCSVQRKISAWQSGHGGPGARGWRARRGA